MNIKHLIMNFIPVLKGCHGRRIALGLLSLCAISISFQSCNMVNEDLKPCAPDPHTYTIVDFEYTYNMSGALTGLYQDWFNNHAGSVYLYVFDEDGKYLLRRENNKTMMAPGKTDFSIALDETELAPGHKYQFVAIAQGNHAGYEASLETPGFVLQHEMEPGVSTIEDYRLKLDRDDDGTYDFGIVNYKDAYGENRQMMDTLWSTKPNSVQVVDVPYIYHPQQVEQLPNDTVKVTVPMMRITNTIRVSLVNENFDADTDPEDYNIILRFPNGNGTIGFTGKVYSNQELLYRSLRKTVREYQAKQGGAQYDTDAIEETKATDANTRATQYCIYAEFGVSRLQVEDGSSLEIYNKNGDLKAKIPNLSDWLAWYFDHRFDDQEFLDREYDYSIDIHVAGYIGDAFWLQAGCSILGWGRREYDYELH